MAFCFACLNTPPSANAQFNDINASTNVPWPSPGHDYIRAGGETVSQVDGQVSFRIDLPVPPGRQFTLPLSISYDSNGTYAPVWSPTPQSSIAGSVQWFQAGSPSGSGGWTYSLPWSSGPTASVIQNNSEYPGGQPAGSIPPCNVYSDWDFYDSDGGRHLLKGLSTNGGGPQCPPSNPFGGDYYYGGRVPDGSTYPGQGLIVSGPKGEAYDFTNTHTGLAVKVEDRNGNFVTLSQATQTSPVVATDTLDRPAFTVTGLTSTSNTVSFADGHSIGVTWQSVPYSFDIKAVLKSNQQGCSFYGPSGSYNVISSITLPDQTSYNFTYDPVTGLLSQITYPTGGWVKYTWGRNSDSASAHFNDASGDTSYACLYHYDKPAITTREVSFDGTTTSLRQTFSYATNWSGDPKFKPLGWVIKRTNVTTTDLGRVHTSEAPRR